MLTDSIINLIDNTLLIQLKVEISDDAIETTRPLAREFGFLLEISSGANVCTARQLFIKISGSIATVLPDRAERHFSTTLI